MSRLNSLNILFCNYMFYFYNLILFLILGKYLSLDSHEQYLKKKSEKQKKIPLTSFIPSS